MIEHLPYARMLGLRVSREADGGLVFVVPWSDLVQGRPGFVHGGAIAGLLELAALGTLHALLKDEAPVTIKPITVTVDYMRGARPLETRASARITRVGKRIANLAAEAWQDDPARPIAAARINVLLNRD